MDGGAVRMQGRGRERQGGGSTPGHVGLGWRGVRALGSSGPGWEAVGQTLPSVLKPLPWASPGPCRGPPLRVQAGPHPSTPTHSCMSVPVAHISTRLHTQLPRPESREVTLATGPHNPGWHALLPPPCPSRPHLLGGGVSAPRWTLAPTLPHQPAGCHTRGPCGFCPGPRVDGTQTPARAGPGGRPAPSGRAWAGSGAPTSAPNPGARLLAPPVPEGAGLLLCPFGPHLVPTCGVYLSSGAS